MTGRIVTLQSSLGSSISRREKRVDSTGTGGSRGRGAGGVGNAGVVAGLAGSRRALPGGVGAGAGGLGRNGTEATVSALGRMPSESK